MPSPFPGMDPYLEDAEIWRDAHHWFITATGGAASAAAQSRGVTTLTSRAESGWRSPNELVYPDVVLCCAARTKRSHRGRTAGGTLVADEPVRLRRRGRRKSGKIISRSTSIENRRVDHGNRIHQSEQQSRPQGQTSFIFASGRKLWAAEVNVVEIDLLRAWQTPCAICRKSVLETDPAEEVCDQCDARRIAWITSFTRWISGRAYRAVGIPLEVG